MSSIGLFIRRVPKRVNDTIRDGKIIKGNLSWRVDLWKLALKDRDVQACFRQAAFDDVLFFFNAFAFIQEPRGVEKTLPFCTWPHQDPVILAMDQAITDAETGGFPLALTLRKSRAQGATYAYIYVFIRRFLRDYGFSAGLVTRNEKTVDSETDKDTLLWKVAWALDQLPFWMLPNGYKRSLTDHTILNPVTGSLFTGYAATGDVGRGGRQTVFAMDEFGSEEFIAGEKDYRVLSSISHVTNCSFLVSTFGGDTGAFYEAAMDPQNPRLVTLDWKDNLTQTRLAYIFREGKAVAVRAEDQEAVTQYIQEHPVEMKRLDRRGHQMEGKFRSPWYDAYCLLPGATPRFIARELDMDPRGTVGKLFPAQVLDRMMKEKAQRPVWEGRAVLRDGELRLVPQEGGLLKLWFKPGLDDAPPAGRYVIGADIATGVGDSNSTLVGGNAVTGEQVLEYADPLIAPPRLARMAAALGKWLYNAELIWETNGPTGKGFGREILKEIGYGYVWRRERENVRTREKTDQAGWVNNLKDAKVELFDDLWIAWDEGLCTPRSEDMLRECGGWERDDKGKIVYHGTGHGDRAIAMGLCWKAMADTVKMGLDNNRQLGQDIQYGTLAWRMERERKVRDRRFSDEDGGEGMGLSELVGVGAISGW